MTHNTTDYSRSLILVMAIAIAFFMVLFYQSGTFQRLELMTLDYRFLHNSTTPPIPSDYQSKIQSRTQFIISIIKNRDFGQHAERDESGRAPKAPGIVFIDMPETGIDYGMSLSHEDCAAAIKILTLWGAKAIVLPTIFREPIAGDYGTTLMGTVASSGRVYLPVLFDIDPSHKEDLYAGEGVHGVKEPWELYSAGGARVGHINGIPDTDGRLRRVPAVIRYKGQTVYQLGMRVAFDMMEVADTDVVLDPEKNTLSYTLYQSEATIPLGSHNQFLIDWGGMRRDNVQHVSFRDILESYRLTLYDGVRPIINPDFIKDKICMLGSAESNRITGMPARYNGYVPPSASALIINSLFERAFIRQAPGGFNIFLIVLVSMVYGSALASSRILRVMMIAVIGVALISFASVYALSNSAVLLAIVFLSVPLGIFFARFRLFSGLLFTVFSTMCYLIVSARLFTMFKVAIVTFYPVFAIFLIFLAFYLYTRLASYLSHVRLFNLATKDGLTSLYNRRHLNLLLDAELNSALLHKVRKMSVVMCDIDNFKKLNDTYGHQAGDAILRDFAKIMKAKCRQSDVVGRYGGEEFLIVLHGAGAADGLKVAEGIRQAIADRRFTFKDQPYSTSLSMGLVEFTSEKTKEELIEKADQALYRAKKEGKNRVCVYE